MAVGLEATNAILLSFLYANPMLPLAAMLRHLQSYTGSPFVALKDKA